MCFFEGANPPLFNSCALKKSNASRRTNTFETAQVVIAVSWLFEQASRNQEIKKSSAGR